MLEVIEYLHRFTLPKNCLQLQKLIETLLSSTESGRQIINPFISPKNHSLQSIDFSSFLAPSLFHGFLPYTFKISTSNLKLMFPRLKVGSSRFNFTLSFNKLPQPGNLRFIHPAPQLIDFVPYILFPGLQLLDFKLGSFLKRLDLRNNPFPKVIHSGRETIAGLNLHDIQSGLPLHQSGLITFKLTLPSSNFLLTPTDDLLAFLQVFASLI